MAHETLIPFPRRQCTGSVGLSYFNPKTDILFVNPRGDDDTWDAPWVRTDLKHKHLEFPETLLHKTKCVSITELDVVHDKRKRNEKLNEMSSRLIQ